MRLGKLSEEELNIALSSLSAGDHVLQSARLGRDCAIIQPRGRLLVTTDPITCQMKDPFELALIVNGNDIYADGGVPLYAMMTVLAPPNTPPLELAEDIARAGRTASEQGIQIIGGHTEFTDAVNRLLISVTMIGEYQSDNIIRGRVRAGDSIIVTKYLALEGSRILLDNHPSSVREIDRQQLLLLNSQSLSVGRESLELQRLGIQVSVMHDITEGGAYGAVCEMVGADDCGAVLNQSDLPLTAATLRLAEIHGFEPGRMLSSGSMLICGGDSDMIISVLRDIGVKATVIGRVTETKGVVLRQADGKEISIKMQPDEIYRLENNRQKS